MRELGALVLALVSVAWLPLRTFRRGPTPEPLRNASIVAAIAAPISLALFVAIFRTTDGVLTFSFVVAALATTVAIGAPSVRKTPARPRRAATSTSVDDDEADDEGPSATLADRIRLAITIVGALVATLPIAVAIGMVAARFLPFPRETRFAIGFLLPLPLWVTGMCMSFVSRRRRLVWIAAALSGSAIAALYAFPAHAQDAAPTPPPPESPAPSPAPPRLEPPRLVTQGEVVLPADVARPAADLTIVVRVTVGVDGQVVDAEVPETAGAAFDSVAIDAARRSTFEPARRDGVAMQARIRFAIVIAAVAPVPAEPGTPTEPNAPSDVPTTPAQPSPEGTTPTEPRAPTEPSAPTRPTTADEPPADAAAATPVDAGPEVIEVDARVESIAEVHERSAEAVDVIDLADARTGSADLGDVIARSEGISIRRSAGLGGQMRFTLNGMSDERVRVFLDGIPLEFAGFPMSFGNMPVSLLERIEIYRGVVPIRFGADALGGAVNLVSPERLTPFSAGLSYQVGSFGTHRLSLLLASRHQRTGVFVRGSGFLDSARNDYPVSVEVADASGRLTPAVVRRFNDAYRAYGGSLEVGIADHRRIRHLSLRGYATQYQKELQNNTIMSVPYGGVHYGEDVYGGIARADITLTDRLSLISAAGYARRRVDFVDQSTCVYNWYGDCVNTRRQPGEIDAEGYDQTLWQDAGFARILLEGRIRDAWILRGAVAPTYVTRDGVDRTTIEGARDPLNAVRQMTNFITSAELVGTFFDDRLETIVFAKNYISHARSTEVTAGDVLRHLSRDTLRLGGGAAGRWAIDDDTYLKASYEYATRLPSPDETFGNGVLIVPNLELRPEISHNVNLGATVSREVSRVGAFRFEGGFFGRFTDQLILLLGNDRLFSYQNVYSARSLGVEVTGRYEFPREWGFLSANFTYQDFRNASSDGTFGAFEGDRIPNQPSMLANFEARVARQDLWQDDELAIGATARYVNEYFRSWESLGSRASKQSIPMQFVVSATVSYNLRFERYRMNAALEFRNLTNAKVYDFFGVQRPGRAYYLALTFEL